MKQYRIRAERVIEYEVFIEAKNDNEAGDRFLEMVEEGTANERELSWQTTDFDCREDYEEVSNISNYLRK